MYSIIGLLCVGQIVLNPSPYRAPPGISLLFLPCLAQINHFNHSIFQCFSLFKDILITHIFPHTRGCPWVMEPEQFSRRIPIRDKLGSPFLLAGLRNLSGISGDHSFYLWQFCGLCKQQIFIE